MNRHYTRKHYNYRSLGVSLQDLDYADDLSILDENSSKKKFFLEIFRVQGARITSENQYSENQVAKNSNKWRWSGDVG